MKLSIDKIILPQYKKMCQNVLKYASSKVDYNLGTSIYMIPSDMNLRIKRNIYNYNNKILISEDSFKIGYNIGGFPLVENFPRTGTEQKLFREQKRKIF